MPTQSKEFKEKKALLEFQKKLDEKRHEMKMEELEYQRKSEAIKHDHDMTRQRIKSAGIRKAEERRMLARSGPQGYGR